MELSRLGCFLREIVKDVLGVIVINCDDADGSFRYSRDIPSTYIPNHRDEFPKPAG
jgi:hypothetical protein